MREMREALRLLRNALPTSFACLVLVVKGAGSCCCCELGASSLFRSGHWALGMRNANNQQPGAGAASRQPPAPPAASALRTWSLELGAAARAYEPGTRAASAPGRLPPVRGRGRGRGASPSAGGVTGHQTQRPRGRVGPPGPHPGGPSSPLDPGGERWPIPRLLALVIAHLVFLCPAGGGVEVLLDEALR
jgi:hypothetical protein